MPDEKDYTEKQLKLREIILDCKSPREALTKAGYSTSTPISPTLKAAGIADIFNRAGLTDERLAAKASEILDAHSTEIIKTGRFVRTVSIPDYSAQLQALNLILKVKGHLTEKEVVGSDVDVKVQIIHIERNDGKDTVIPNCQGRESYPTDRIISQTIPGNRMPEEASAPVRRVSFGKDSVGAD